ncbi:hypothetical protein H4219_002010 [Mycoemilia scoparia]|uniref:Nuclear pore complex protein Nup160 n=1 Tax=Mycoemilia scoparia TaxID=417184 RepID=A0A9W8DR67_9FUNG|nr:hypothetical protein H4219_002010 [Mycoemilia scoparia]
MFDMALNPDDTADTNAVRRDRAQQLQLFHTVPFYTDNVFPYNPSQSQTHVLPNPYHIGNNLNPGAQAHGDRMALHLSAAAQSGLYSIRNHADKCISWRVLSDRRTLELRAIKWITTAQGPLATDGGTKSSIGKNINRPSGATEAQKQELEHSKIGSYVFPAPILPGLTIFDDTYSGHISVMCCTETGVIYRLSFGSFWEVSKKGWSPDTDSSYYAIERYKGKGGAVVSGRNPVGAHVVDANTVLVACADGSLSVISGFITPEEQRGDLKNFVEETNLSSSGVMSSMRQFIPRILGRGNPPDQSISGASQPVALSAISLHSDQVKIGVTLDRDRRLRLWSLQNQMACIHTEQLPTLDQKGQPIPHNPEEFTPPLPDNRVRMYIKPLSSKDSGYYEGQFVVAVYVPDSTTPYFTLIEGEVSNSGKLQRIGILMQRTCWSTHGGSPLIAGDDYVDFQVVQRVSALDSQNIDATDDGRQDFEGTANRKWTLWALWERDQDSILTYTHFTLKNNNGTHHPLEYDGDILFGERWYSVIRESSASKPTATGGKISSIDFYSAETLDAQEEISKDGEISENGTNVASQLAAEITDAFMSHLFDPLRFDRGVLAHSLALYEQSVKDRGHSLPALSKSSGLPPLASQPGLYSRAASVVGSFLRVEVSREDGTLLVSDYRRALYTEWMRYATLCSRLQRGANVPCALSFCVETQMLTIVRGNSLAPLQTAGEVEWMCAVMSGDPAASILQNAPSSLLVSSYPELAPKNARTEVARLLSASAYVSRILGPDCVAFFTHEVTQMPLNSLCVPLDFAMVEQFEALKLSASTWNQAHVRRTIRLLRYCEAPSQTIIEILRVLVLSSLPSAETYIYDEQSPDPIEAREDAGGFKTSVAMDGLVTAAYSLSIKSRFTLVRDILLLLTVITYYDEDANGILSDLYGLLTSTASTFRVFSVMHWISMQPLYTLSSQLGTTSSLKTTDDHFLSCFSDMHLTRANLDSPSADASAGANGGGVLQDSSATNSVVYSLLHAYIHKVISLTFGGNTGRFADMITEAASQLDLHLQFTIFTALNAQPDSLLDPMAYAEKSMIEYGANLALITTPDMVNAYLDYLQPSSAVNYLRGQMYFRLKDYDKASMYFSRAATVYLQNNYKLSPKSVLYSVLPENVAIKGLASSYYQHLAELFGQVRKFDAVNRFCYLAIEAANSEKDMIDENELIDFKQNNWFKIFHSALDNNLYEEAYLAMMANPDQRMRTDCLRHLVAVLCESTEGVSLLCRLGFPGLQEEVEANLLFKARNSDLFAHPNYYQILHSFHVYRSDYRAAASAMYQHAKRLGAAMPFATDILSTITDQAQAYLSCINALQLVDSASAWIVVSRQGGNKNGQKRKKRRVEIERFSPTKDGQAINELDIVELVDVRREYNLTLARLQLSSKYPEFRTQNIQLDAEDAIVLFMKVGMYDQALSISQSYKLDLTSLFESLTHKCLDLSLRKNIDDRISDNDDAFWENEDILESAGSQPDRAWNLLHSYLKRIEQGHEKEGKFKYHYHVAVTILDSEHDVRLPPWLSSILLENRPQDLIRACLKHGSIVEAAEFLVQHINSKAALLASPSYLAKSTCEFWLPYALIDQTIRVLDSAIAKLGDSKKDDQQLTKSSQRGIEMRLNLFKILHKNLKEALDSYIHHAQRESKDIGMESVGNSSSVFPIPALS